MENAVPNPRVLIVAEHASARFGGEAILPLHYFRMLRKRGVECWLIVHSRTRDELENLFTVDRDRIRFIPDSLLHKFLFHIGKPLPGRLRHFSLGYISRLSTQRQARRIARQMIPEHQIDLVHQPIPVSPRESSLLYGLGIPVIMGPMNGGMAYPPGFNKGQQSWIEGAFLKVGRLFSGAINRLMPGKLRADVLLVANERTRRSLPRGTRGRVIVLTENGVDLSLWKTIERDRPENAVPRFIFSGRLIQLKGVEFLLPAFRKVIDQTPATLDILGDGPMRQTWEAQARALGLADHVIFHGWVSQADLPRRIAEGDALILPSLHECGGAVVLEAMAMGRPVIATNWGGPADYLDETCGILVTPGSPEQFTRYLTAAMLRLARDPSLRRAMGEAGRRRIETQFDWERKTDQILDIYRQALAQAREK